ncbi:50S ribosomal protein L11 methyltransferase [Iamia majanohamensis]|uniref:Ribosomal protein L11 methyltransferase n=1 Tax=Iamia majanohamensis TaxID=467976 RepID=A0AAE9YBX3_9ACTN|nr:50S ribosomal protein L11 methyltransferase [Iamia majanohamensis]WCO68313.1 50S ribosomal protein L11 methyltransferase [Iamia majanohamensis]
MTGVRVVEVDVADDEVDLASGLLWSAGVTAVAEHPAPAGGVRLRAALPDGGVSAVEGAIEGRWAVRVVDVADDGLDAWRAHAQVVTVGPRLVVRPPWVPLGPVVPGAVVVEVDPGAAFGHGAHPTTRLCLAAVEAMLAARPGVTVLDVGCGSGVLAVAAAALGAERVVAVDVDPVAIDVTRENAARNDVEAVVDARLVDAEDADDPLGAAPGRADLVVANIGAGALRALAPHLRSRVGADGRLVLSGLLDPPDAEVVAAHAPLVEVRRATEDGWVALTLAAP